MVRRIFVVNLIIIGSFLMVPFLYPGGYLRLGNYRIASSDYAIGINHSAFPAEYYTISPFDDLLITSNGQEIKTAISSTMSFQQDRTLDRLVNSYKSFLNTYLFHRLEVRFGAGVEPKLSYSIESSGHNIIISRQVKWVLSEKIVGIGRSLLLPPENTLFFDGLTVSNFQHYKVMESNLYELIGIGEIESKSPYTQGSVKLRVNPSDRIIYDDQYDVITIKHYFNTSDDRFVDQQILEIE